MFKKSQGMGKGCLGSTHKSSTAGRFTFLLCNVIRAQLVIMKKNVPKLAHLWNYMQKPTIPNLLLLYHKN